MLVVALLSRPAADGFTDDPVPLLDVALDGISIPPSRAFGIGAGAYDVVT